MVHGLSVCHGMEPHPLRPTAKVDETQPLQR